MSLGSKTKVFARMALALTFMSCLVGQTALADGTTKIGVLHSLTGTMAISEKPVVDAVEMAVDEINKAGGVNGKKLEIVKADGASDWDKFKDQAEKLISTDKVKAVFGCWTSSSRKSVLPVFEKHDHLLFYPVQYEGKESSKNIIYTGAAPNQQIIPAVKWALSNLGKGDKVYLVGSDYIYPRTANAIVREMLKAQGKEPIGEMYRPLGDKSFAEIAADIKAKKPSFIINTINGDSNIAFFNELKKAGMAEGDSKIPVISMSIAEPELKEIAKQTGPELLKDHFATWNYFQSIKSAKNTEFVKKFKEKYGADAVTSDPLEAAYFGVYLYAAAIKKAKTDDTAAVRKALLGLTFNAPGGEVKIDPENQHTWRPVKVGKIRMDGQFDIVWDSKNSVRPDPYPKF